MIQFDIVIVSDARDVYRRDVTQSCIDSIFRTKEVGYAYKVIVVEANKNVEYKDCLTLHYDFDFNYNKCLNLGLKHSMSKYKGICNNDLIFHHGWASALKKVFDMGYGSVSPYCKKTHSRFYEMGNIIYKGYEIGKHIAGWAIFFTDLTLEKIGKLNENVSFWYSDNIYAEQIKIESIQHCLVCNSFVTHLGSTTLKSIKDRGIVRGLTMGQAKVFESEKRKLWKRNSESVYDDKEVVLDNIVKLKK